MGRMVVGRLIHFLLFIFYLRTFCWHLRNGVKRLDSLWISWKRIFRNRRTIVVQTDSDTCMRHQTIIQINSVPWTRNGYKYTIKPASQLYPVLPLRFYLSIPSSEFFDSFPTGWWGRRRARYRFGRDGKHHFHKCVMSCGALCECVRMSSYRYSWIEVNFWIAKHTLWKRSLVLRNVTTIQIAFLLWGICVGSPVHVLHVHLCVKQITAGFDEFMLVLANSHSEAITFIFISPSKINYIFELLFSFLFHSSEIRMRECKAWISLKSWKQTELWWFNLCHIIEFLESLEILVRNCPFVISHRN